MTEKSEAIFQPIFGESWNVLPLVLKKHYANRPYSDDVVQLDGTMDISLSPLTRLMKPLFKLFGALVPYEGENIPTTVYSKSEVNSDRFVLERHFDFPNQKPYVFRSVFVHLKDNEVLEIMKFGIGWKCGYSYDGNKVQLMHKGFYWRVSGLMIPLPFSIILGRGYAEEVAIDEENFQMSMIITHPIFGNTFEYKGWFKVA